MGTPNRLTAFVTSVAISATATFALLTFLETGDAKPPEGSSPVATRAASTPTPITSDEPRFAVVEGANQAGGYSFRYPPGWTLAKNESVSTLTSPDEATVVSFGFGSPGDLAASASAFAELLRGTYDVLDMKAARPTTINGLPARVVEGSALNTDDVEVFFQAFTVRSGGENFAISVFSKRPPAPAVDEIVDSFGPVLEG